MGFPCGVMIVSGALTMRVRSALQAPVASLPERFLSSAPYAMLSVVRVAGGAATGADEPAGGPEVLTGAPQAVRSRSNGIQTRPRIAKPSPEVSPAYHI